MAEINVKGMRWFTGYRQSGRGTNDLSLVAEAIWKSRKIKRQGDRKIAWADQVGLNLRTDRFFLHGYELRAHEWYDMENGFEIKFDTPRADYAGVFVVRKAGGVEL